MITKIIEFLKSLKQANAGAKNPMDSCNWAPYYTGQCKLPAHSITPSGK